MSSYSNKLDAMQVLRHPIIEQAARSVGIRPGSKGLDVGCGNGLQTLLFAEMCGPDGSVTGLDASAELIDLARQNTPQAGIGQCTEFIKGQAGDMPFRANTFDWTISIDCIGYGARSFEKEIREMARVARPGGVVALMAWTGQQILGGHALLEAKLNATPDGLAPHTTTTDPSIHFLGCGSRLSAAGIVNIQAKTMAATFIGPLDVAEQKALVSLINMRWPNAHKYLDEQELNLLHELGNHDSKEYLLNSNAYCGMFFYTLLWGTKGSPAA